jgi:hypothetical protein
VIDTGIDAGHPDLDGRKVIAFANCSGQRCAVDRRWTTAATGPSSSPRSPERGEGRADRLYRGVAPQARRRQPSR